MFNDAIVRLAVRAYVLSIPMLFKEDDLIPLMAANQAYFLEGGIAIQYMQTAGAALCKGRWRTTVSILRNNCLVTWLRTLHGWPSRWMQKWQVTVSWLDRNSSGCHRSCPQPLEAILHPIRPRQLHSDNKKLPRFNCITR